MKNTAGIEIPERNQHCDCGLTGGCEKCNPMLKTSNQEQSWEKDFVKKFGNYFQINPEGLHECIVYISEEIKKAVEQRDKEILGLIGSNLSYAPCDDRNPVDLYYHITKEHWEELKQKIMEGRE